jgi:hypothetical protein
MGEIKAFFGEFHQKRNLTVIETRNSLGPQKVEVSLSNIDEEHLYWQYFPIIHQETKQQTTQNVKICVPIHKKNFFGIHLRQLIFIYGR